MVRSPSRHIGSPPRHIGGSARGSHQFSLYFQRRDLEGRLQQYLNSGDRAASIDRARFQGQPTDCTATTYQITPSWRPCRSAPAYGIAGLTDTTFLPVVVWVM
jgi:hypothetical protein